MTEYKTFDDYVMKVLHLEPTELTHISPEEQKKKTVRITVDELINIWNEVTELQAQIGKMKCCSNCDNWNWKHSKCEKKLKGDCFKQSKWILRR